MKILPHPAPRQIPSNSVKFWRPVGPPRQSRQIPAAPRAPVKFRQIPSKYGPRSGPYYPPLTPADHRYALLWGTLALDLIVFCTYL